jgi:plastocyanin
MSALSFSAALVAAATLVALGASPAVRAAQVSVSVVDAAGAPAPDVAIILVAEAFNPSRPAAPMPPVQIVQRDMKFFPVLTIITPGTPLRFVNHDAWDHHVRGSAGASFEFRIGAARSEGASAATAARPADVREIVIEGASGPVRLGCHLHSRMSADIFVSESPHFAVTDEQGTARLAAVPEGAYRVMTWHPRQVIDQPPLRTRIGAEAVQVPVALNFTVPRRR